MATYDWNLPTVTTNYSTFVTELHNRLNQIAAGFPSVDTHNNLIVDTISFRDNKWRKWTGTTWQDLTNSYAINISGSANNLSGILGVANGGTSITSYTIGDLIYASGSTTLSKLTAVVSGNVLVSGGAGSAPSWGKVGLSTHISGTLSVSNGGTGSTNLSGILKGNGTGAISTAVAGTDYAAVNHNHDTTYASITHTHTYLPLSGGTLSGNLSILNANNEVTLSLGNSGAYIYGNNSTYGIYKTGQGHFQFDIVSGNLNTTGTFTCGSSLTVSSGNLTISSGNLTVSGSITASDSLTVSSGNLIVSSGDITASGNVTAYSDIRLKSNISTIESALTKVLKLRGVSYTKAGTPEIGVIAQEVELVVPEVVYDGEYKSVAYGNLVALLIEAIKELNEKLDARASN